MTTLTNQVKTNIFAAVLTAGFALLLIAGLGIPQPAHAQQATSTLTIIKEVVNDDGGMATSADFTIDVVNASSGSTTASFSGSATGTDITVDQGVTYEISETASTSVSSSYQASFSGDCNADGTITPASATATCTITNNDQPDSTSQPASSGGGDRLAPRDDDTDNNDEDTDDEDSDDDDGEVLGEHDDGDDEVMTDAEISLALRQMSMQLYNLLAILQDRAVGFPNTGDGSLSDRIFAQ